MSFSPQSILRPAFAGVRGAIPYHYYGGDASAGSYVIEAENMEIVDGKWRTRSPWIALQREGAPSDYDSFGLQSATRYNPQNGQGVYPFGQGENRIVSSDCGYLHTISVSGDGTYCVERSCDYQQVPEKFVVWLDQIEGYVVRTHPDSDTLVLEPDGTCGTSPGYTDVSRETSWIPNGARGVAEYGTMSWASVGRSTLASDYLFSTVDTLDTPIDILRYRDQTYDATNVPFTAGASTGEILTKFTAISSLNSDSRSETGLVVTTLCPPTMHIIKAGGIPKDQWQATPNLMSPLSLETAPAGINLYAARDGDIIFRSREGIESVKTLVNQQSGVTNQNPNIGKQIEKYLDADPPDELIYGSMLNNQYTERLLVTTKPIRDGARRWHRGYMSAHINPLKAEFAQLNQLAWEGLHFIEGWGISQLLEMPWNGGHETPFALLDSGDARGVARKTKRQSGGDILPDGTVSQIPVKLQTGKIYVGGSEYKKGTLDNVYVLLEDIYGDAEWMLEARTDVSDGWEKIGCGEVCGNVACDFAEYHDIYEPIRENDLGKFRYIEFRFTGKGSFSPDFVPEFGRDNGHSPEIEESSRNQSVCEHICVEDV